MFGYSALGVLLLLMAAMPEIGLAQSAYEIVRGQRLPVCVALHKNLKAFADDPPMTCKRELYSQAGGLTLPAWQPLRDDVALQVALALERALAQKGPADQFEKRFAVASAAVNKSAAERRLRAWEAHFDIAQSGEVVRVVLVSNGECGSKHEFSWNDPVFGVLLPESNEVDPRYRSISRYPGDILLYQGKPYVALWTDGAGPRKRHRGYILLSPTFTLAQERSVGVGEPVCQIGYERLGKNGKRGVRLQP